MNENVIYSSEASLKACRLKPYLALLIGPSIERPSLFEPGEKFPRGFCIMGDDSFAALTSSATEVEVGSEQHGIVPDGKFPIERFNSSSKKGKKNIISKSADSAHVHAPLSGRTCRRCSRRRAGRAEDALDS
jgi:hypothetical protein